MSAAACHWLGGAGRPRLRRWSPILETSSSWVESRYWNDQTTLVKLETETDMWSDWHWNDQITIYHSDQYVYDSHDFEAQRHIVIPTTDSVLSPTHLEGRQPAPGPTEAVMQRRSLAARQCHYARWASGLLAANHCDCGPGDLIIDFL
jgi:hypothetical protein